ncbi:MAG: carboxymuconolactone decarboxylase family protein [Candidatus Accumulibacter sp.]|jgi:quercetin dioxygenase-like cupin family protein/alkylhydroperoxidase/carboxymuconolactone decarboxylase family protein YurZ|nr:carboxymuconolactone decarboxylase family protein [Accumulibacter sp.]
MGLWAAFMGVVAVSGARAAESALNAKQQSVVAISALTARGDIEKLKIALNEGLDAKLTINEIKEILVQLYAYAGFPRSLNGINAFMAVLDERRKNGLRDEEGRDASPPPAVWNRDEFGARMRARLAGQTEIPPPAGYQLFAPAIDAFLKEHLFADIFVRDNLDHQTRELATISALAGMTGTAGQLRFHLRAAMNMGLNEAQMKHFAAVVENCVGKEQAAMVNEVLSGILETQPAQKGNAMNETGQTRQTLVRAADLPTIQGAREYFTGDVRITRLFGAKFPDAPFGAGIVRFAPGARTFWHTHPAGQHLIVTEGVGRTGTADGRIKEFRAGDALWCPAGIKHWHGASPGAPMTHIALTGALPDGKNVEWMEEVSDEQYGGNP